MAENDWTLVEYRPGRYVKVSSSGEVIGKATEAEARAWFGRRGWPLEAAIEDQTASLQSPDLEPASTRPPTGLEAESEEAEPASPVTGEEQVVPDVVSGEQAKPEPEGPEAGMPSDVGSSPPDEVELLEVDDVVQAERDSEEAGEGRPDAVPAAQEAEADTGAELREPGGPPAEPPGAVEDRWLWLDPRGDARYGGDAFDISAFLRQAASRFQAKEWAGGAVPGRLAVHPDLVTERLETAAGELGLEVIADPKVMVGTYMLALAESEKEL